MKSQTANCVHPAGCWCDVLYYKCSSTQQDPCLPNKLLFHPCCQQYFPKMSWRCSRCLCQSWAGFFYLFRSIVHARVCVLKTIIQEIHAHHHTYVSCCQTSTGTLPLSWSFSPHAVSEGGRKRYPTPPPTPSPPPSWPAKMSGRSQRKRDYQQYGFRLYKCVSLFWCQQRMRCERVTFGDNKISSPACGAALDRTHHRW